MPSGLQTLDKMLCDMNTAYEALDATERREFAAGLIPFAEALYANEGMSEPERMLFAATPVPLCLSVVPLRPEFLDAQKKAELISMIPYLRELKRFECTT